MKNSAPSDEVVKIFSALSKKSLCVFLIKSSLIFTLLPLFGRREQAFSADSSPPNKRKRAEIKGKIFDHTARRQGTFLG